jgi:hypothetical protein
MFPWLSGIAMMYEKYQFLDLCFEYVSRSPTSTSGMVVLSYDQDPSDVYPTEDEAGRRRMLAAPGSVAGNSWLSSKCHVPHSVIVQLGERFIRNQAEATTIEPRTADSGIVWVGAFGVPTSQLLGDIFVEYKIRLSVPQITGVSAPLDTEGIVASSLWEGDLGQLEHMNKRYPFTSQYGADGFSINDDNLIAEEGISTYVGQTVLRWRGGAFTGNVRVLLPQVDIYVPFDWNTAFTALLLISYTAAFASAFRSIGRVRYTK